MLRDSALYGDDVNISVICHNNYTELQQDMPYLHDIKLTVILIINY